jgi:hypothetical protein
MIDEFGTLATNKRFAIREEVLFCSTPSEEPFCNIVYRPGRSYERVDNIRDRVCVSHKNTIN